ncbi:hypothetical protein M670_02107 [Schinkia azotoformans MEV2011]|uniref:Uncharacterized protein n=1 Tax=Schinkia azotoformans MEV2011 TaxID=1348973 RepID=A0A072NLZ6_SCHAZ|nr:hypothetical protein [Schinkia azotoformans]KEF38481.1 hypothetical protein M670_02107 [Schinkia azotoformans MEV2011]MEC1695662.1 hypothetical protein [Schinkia azotoformans]MEC1717666.1 hypothetical protein [Schinkia azotoformans]MEC1727673.1 hypothetical protein [Schinkia azotoformans]MEC1742396.1 hypothetical protein [Schinkia azotoformans]
MKEIDFSDLNDWIQSNKQDVERQLLQEKSEQRTFRTRPRDPDEIKILDILSKKKWEKAEQEGKIKYLSERVWYYELD